MFPENLLVPESSCLKTRIDPLLMPVSYVHAQCLLVSSMREARPFKVQGMVLDRESKFGVDVPRSVCC